MNATLPSLPQTALPAPFSRVLVLHLERRTDRIDAWTREWIRVGQPWADRLAIHPAVDGLDPRYPTPQGWRAGVGPWGCLLTHATAVSMALTGGWESVLILEDDACFCANFHARFARWLAAVPSDWDGLMLGGQHLPDAGEPIDHAPDAAVCVRAATHLHAYAIRPKLMRAYLTALEGSLDHCDWTWATVPSILPAHKVYAPGRWLIGQSGSKSDNTGLCGQPNFFDAQE